MSEDEHIFLNKTIKYKTVHDNSNINKTMNRSKSV